MSLLPLLRTAGSLPVAQLNMRASGTPQQVIGELKALVDEGLVSIEGGHIPETSDQLESSHALVKLTVTGTGRAFR